jgi:hypothetical protein
VTTDTAKPTPASPFAFEDPTDEIHAAMVAYTPADLPAHVWQTVAPACIALVQQAGTADKERVVKDLQILAKTATVMLERNRPVTLEELLSDGALRDLDHAEQQAGLARKTRRNHRAMMHRLQAIHRGLPWQPGRRKQTRESGPDAAAELDHLARLAAGAASGDAQAFNAVLAGSDRLPGGLTAGSSSAPATWAAARRFAALHGVRLTKAALKEAATLRVLSQPAPVADLVARCQLTRRDLDLAVPAAAALPDHPDEHTARALRGSSQN